MSKPDPARGWLYSEKLLDEEEDVRIKSLGDAELRAELAPIRRPWRAVGLVAAARVAPFLLVKASEPPDVSARPTGRDLANAEREQAFASCAMKEWSACKAKLDDAARLDPAGESEPRVQQTRREIESAAARLLDGGAP